MKKVAAEIKPIEPRALYLHCYDHSISYQDGASLLRFEKGLIFYPTGTVECTRHLALGGLRNTSSILVKE